MTTSAAVLLVGDELLSGRRRDANGVWMARRIAELGVRLHEIRVVSDDVEALAAAVQSIATDVDWILLSGGLGPTVDDVTREGIARALGETMREDPEAWAALQACMRERGRPLGPGIRRQALIPESGRWLHNAVGVSPGVRCRVGAAELLAFPGVPRELQTMFEQHFVPALDPARTERPEQAVLWICGIPESSVAEKLVGAAAAEAVDLAYYPHDGEVELRLSAVGADAAARVAAAHDEARARLGAHVFDPPAGGRIEHAVVQALAARGRRVTTVESVTGGLLARMLTRVPGASAVYPVGWVTYATAQKTVQVGVPEALLAEHCVVSAEVARAMAEGARARAETDAALATTGTAGPDPLIEAGRPPVPPGRVYVAVAFEGRVTVVEELTLPHPRELVQRFAAVRALDLLRRALDAEESAS